MAHLEAKPKTAENTRLPDTGNLDGGWVREMIGKIRLYFDMDELIDLCLNVEVDYQTLDHDNKNVLARSLVLHCDRHSKEQILVETCQNLRKDVFWPYI